MSDFTEIIMDNVDDLTFENETKVLETMQMELNKEFMYLEYYADSCLQNGEQIYTEGHGISNFFNKLLTVLKNWYKMIKAWLRHVKEVAGAMLSKIRKSGLTKSASAIAKEHAKERLDQGNQLAESKARVRVPYLGGMPESDIEVYNSNLLITKFISDTEFEIGVFTATNYMKDERNGKKIAMKPHSDTAVPDIDSLVPHDIRSIYLMKNPGILSDLNELVKDAAKIASGDKSINQIEFCKKSKALRHKFKNPMKYFKCFVSGKTRLSMGELTEFQKRVNEALIDLDSIHSIENDLSTVRDDTIKELRKLVYDVHYIQYDMNTFTNMIQKVNLIDLKFMNSIKDRNVLSKFVSDLIKNGIPSKFVAYNTWLIASEDIRGSKPECKLAMGQSRCVFFPNDNKNEILKIALNGFGITSNRNEIRFAKAVSSEPELRKITAMVTNAYAEDGIIAAERIVDKSGGKHPSLKECKAMSDAYDKFTKQHPELRLKIKDFHDENVMWSSDRNCWVSIDYGFSNRVDSKGDDGK
jgi:hypothetical protein